MTEIAFLTMDSLDDFVAYDHLLTAELNRRGIEVREISWRARDVAWADYPLVVIRSPWDYQQDLPGFLKVLTEIDASGARMENNLSVCQWNCRKSYLRDLQQAGLSIIPTTWLDEVTVQSLADATAQISEPELIMKPLIGANADLTERLPSALTKTQLQQLVSLYQGRSVLVQPFLTSVLDPGEYSLIYFNGNFSHAILKTPASGDFRVQEEHGSTITPVAPPVAVRQLADRTIHELPSDLLYARVDILLLAPEQPALIEVELIEPSLYLPFHPQATKRFCEAILQRL